jgi:hypothetical protein
MSEKANTPRKKSCNLCSKAKVRCGLERPRCARCRNRDARCEYVDAKAEDPAAKSVPATTNIVNDVPVVAYRRSQQPNSPEVVSFDDVQLICTVDDYRIRARWLESVLPSADQTPKPFQASTMAFVGSIFKSYPGVFLNDKDLPPYIHWTQTAGTIPEALANCMNISRMWKTQATGSESMVCEVIEKEMSRLFEQESTTPNVYYPGLTPGKSVPVVVIWIFLQLYRPTYSMR